MTRTICAAAIAMALLLAGCSTMSTQQEVQLGQQEAQQVSQQLAIVQDPAINRYINVLGDSIARLSDPRHLTWHFYVVNTSQVNAFAVPGGFVYVNRGLIQLADNMSELAGVVSHEIAHVILRHSVQQIQQQQEANVGLVIGCTLTKVCNNQAAGAAINVFGTALFAKFSRTDEAQADSAAVPEVVRAGISPTGLPDMFKKMMAMQQSQPSSLDAWFATHPTDQARIASTQAEINKIDPAIVRSLTVDTPNFQTFKQEVAALPAPPPPPPQTPTQTAPPPSGR